MEILIAVFEGFIGSALLAYSIGFYNKRNKQKFKKIFSKKSSDKYYIAVTAFEPTTLDLYYRPKTGYGELISLANISKSIAYCDNYDKLISFVYLSSENSFSAHLFDENLIVIGGSTHNRVMRFFKTKISNLLRVKIYDEYSGRIKSSADFCLIDYEGNKYKSVVDNHIITKDYGLVTKIPNPINKQRTLILIDGLHTFGLVAASKFLLHEYIKQYYLQINKLNDNYFQIIIEADVKDYEVFIKNIKYFKINV